ncbi:MAG: Adenylate kinase [Candidatus Amesbacteria bacterium GW2011_GWA2_47_11b]|uniref:Adenylate kinase n=3 Tax=Candidatus Amesiibacteriota TaxID=1752730 RepID=A0A0G1SHT9_9BACT|nr:MAG: Adenylate kinase [Microgenomates group bacterium GW2011_GWC1_46_20]KKU58198.1 MAG: Adenylate kinase [Candidatus Amesbacteria bacterium GW2011_GWA2_47_11b]KKU68991.1 MAG: Adenylate kinase [Candidatus Amesbacteria bacterium GW2011_GWA1_47_20]KKU83371.1 MAG: Adenylate kinase [Candidatus Amesbacteria bacterium GW2011_GWC2_47_8]
MGPPTSGKSSVASLLSKEFRTRLIRGRDVVPNLTETYGSFRSLIPDRIFLPKLKGKMDGLGDRENITLDNIPRTKMQAELIVDWSVTFRATVVTILLNLSKQEVVDRVKGRLTCPTCGESYHQLLKPPKWGGLCDNDRNALTVRSGDKDIKIVEKAFEDYSRLVGSLLGILETKSTVVQIPASGTVNQTYMSLISKLRVKGN